MMTQILVKPLCIASFCVSPSLIYEIHLIVPAYVFFKIDTQTFSCAHFNGKKRSMKRW